MHRAHADHIKLRNQTGLIVLAAFTFVSVLGYAVFVVPPHGPANIAKIADIPWLINFYSVSFSFFGRIHVWLSTFVLVAFLYRTVRLRWTLSFVAVFLVSLGSELAGTSLGVPFGPYSYTDLLGTKILGLVPVVIPISWYLMALPSFALANRGFPSSAFARIVFGAMLLTFWDLALDPAMSYLTSYWIWDETGPYYGMPSLNLVGWYVTGLALMVIFEWLGATDWVSRLPIRWLGAFYLLSLALPLGMMLAAGLWSGILLTSGLVFATFGFIGKRGVRSSSDDVVSPTSTEVASYFAYHSKSFSFAANWFAPRERELVGKLYAFCRHTDDLVDGASAGDDNKLQRLDEWEKRVVAAYNGEPTDRRWLDDLMSATRRAEMPLSIVTDLIAGVRSDVGRVRVPDLDSLQHYCYQVAGTVGVWLCYLFESTDKLTLDRAIRLGRALQITNILRDVGTDLDMDRIYLPATMMEANGVDEEELRVMRLKPEAISPGYIKLIEDLTLSAEEEYDRAWEGIYRLQGSFGRAAAVAAMVYRGILRKIRKNGYNNLTKRAFTSGPAKLVLATQGLRRRRRGRRALLHKSPSATADHGEPDSVDWLEKLSSAKQHLMVFLLPLLFVVPTVAQSYDLHDVREFYIRSEGNRQLIDSTLQAVSGLADPQAPLAEAYVAAATIMRAKHARWPLTKMKHLKRGLPTLDNLVQSHPEHVEIRYLRLISCFYLPRFLGRTWSKEEDMAFLEQNLAGVRETVEPQVYEMMAEFVMLNGNLSESEVEALHVSPANQEVQ